MEETERKQPKLEKEKNEGDTTILQQSKKVAFQADTTDFWFCIFCVAMGYWYFRWGVPFWKGVGLSVFTAFYAGGTLLYFYKKGNKMEGKESWFWLFILLGTGISCAFYRQESFFGIRFLFLTGVAVYWVLHITGCLLEKKTGNWMPGDLLNGFFVIPFRNYWCLFQAAVKGTNCKQGKTISGIFLGVLLCIPVLGIVLPLLLNADMGFQVFISQITGNLDKILFRFIMYFIGSLPIACYLFGMIAGCVHKRKTRIFSEQTDLRGMTDSVRIFPMASIYTVMVVICLVYLLFICLQARYLFSAFLSTKPYGLETYASYARQGFFELCKVAGFNIFLLFFCNCFGKGKSRNALFTFLNCAFSILTLLLIATAFRKMLLYVAVYGLSHKRFLTCYFMFFMAGGYLLIILRQIKSFSIVRSFAVLGSVMFVLLCFTNIDSMIASYNIERFKEGTLPDFSLHFLNDCGFGGIDAAVALYENEDLSLDAEENLLQYFNSIEISLKKSDWFHKTLEMRKAVSYDLKQYIPRILPD